MNPILASDLNLITRLWLLALDFILGISKLVVKLNAEVADQRIKIVEFRLTHRALQLVYVGLDVRLVLDYPQQELSDLCFDPLKFAILLIKVKDVPNSVLIQFWGILIASVLYDHGNVALLVAEEHDDLEDFGAGIRCMNHLTILIVRVRYRRQSLQNPLDFLVKFLLIVLLS